MSELSSYDTSQLRENTLVRILSHKANNTPLYVVKNYGTKVRAFQNARPSNDPWAGIFVVHRVGGWILFETYSKNNGMLFILFTSSRISIKWIARNGGYY